MTAKVEVVGGCKILRVGGRIDFESALDFEQRINSMIQEEGDCFIIELSAVELLSSAGLRVLLSTAKRISHRNASLGLAAPSHVVRQVFEISHFNLLFKIFPSVSEAVTALKGPAAIIQPGETIPLRDASQESHLSETSTLEEEPKSSVPMARDIEAAPGPATRGVEPPKLPPVAPPRPPMAAVQSEAATVAPLSPSLPVTLSAQAPSVAVPPRPAPLTRSSGAPPGSALPPPLPRGVQKAPAGRGAERPPGVQPRREAKFPARLEVRAEGISYPCKDGDVIGTAGQLASPYFSQISNLAPRHLLIGKSDERWFLFTPKNVQHPFTLDGIPLRTGERKFLQYDEHQAEFNGHVFGLRLLEEERKEGLLSRMFGRKQPK
jgi:anti-anti-sigma factor